MPEPVTTDCYDQFVALFARHERAIRAVVRSMLASSQDVDDVMQEVGLACWHKFPEFRANDVTDAFFRWACVVSRFEVLKYRRKQARDRLILSDETIRLLSDDALQRAAAIDNERLAIEDCLDRLRPADRRLVLSVHARGDSVAQIARQVGQGVRRLYSRVNVLRDILGECVRRQLAEGEV
ncbi:MAG: sigma-70 family RNA polymerase sigma factor [Planctomycetota bacterium]